MQFVKKGINSVPRRRRASLSDSPNGTVLVDSIVLADRRHHSRDLARHFSCTCLANFRLAKSVLCSTILALLAWGCRHRLWIDSKGTVIDCHLRVSALSLHKSKLASFSRKFQIKKSPIFYLCLAAQ